MGKNELYWIELNQIVYSSERACQSPEIEKFQYIYDHENKIGIVKEKMGGREHVRLCLQGEIETLEKQIINPSSTTKIKKIPPGNRWLFAAIIGALKRIQNKKQQIENLQRDANHCLTELLNRIQGTKYHLTEEGKKVLKEFNLLRSKKSSL